MSEQYYKSQVETNYYNEYYDTDDDVVDELGEKELLFEDEVRMIYDFIDEVRHDTVFPFLDKLTFESLLDFLKDSESLQTE
jgi:hypothetical protein